MKPGETLPGMQRPRNREGSRNKNDNRPPQIDGQRIEIDTLINGILRLDNDQDKKLRRSEVPKKHQLFNQLDQNGDDILTIDKTLESLRRQQNR